MNLEQKQLIANKVISQIKKDVQNGDTTAIEDLLFTVVNKDNLSYFTTYLSENNDLEETSPYYGFKPGY